MSTFPILDIEATVEAEHLTDVLDAHHVAWHDIAHPNWGAFPYAPRAKFRLAAGHDCLLLQYHVEEKTVMALRHADNQDVWNDSTVELFLQPTADGPYYNLETNCIGTVLLGYGTGRTDRQRVSPTLLGQIKRHSTLGSQPFAERPSATPWQLSLVVPLSVFTQHDLSTLLSSPSAAPLRANVYKCGDQLHTPHYLSWHPIRTEKPDFHRPEFFGEITFV